MSDQERSDVMESPFGLNIYLGDTGVKHSLFTKCQFCLSSENIGVTFEFTLSDEISFRLNI